MIQRITFIFATAMVITACNKFDDGTSRLRLENLSTHTFNHITAHSANFGQLDAGETSQYVLVENLFTSVSISLQVDTVNLQSIVIDHVGEEPLKPGDFTLQVNITGDIGRGAGLTSELIRD